MCMEIQAKRFLGEVVIIIKRFSCMNAFVLVSSVLNMILTLTLNT